MYSSSSDEVLQSTVRHVGWYWGCANVGCPNPNPNPNWRYWGCANVGCVCLVRLTIRFFSAHARNVVGALSGSVFYIVNVAAVCHSGHVDELAWQSV